jgi:hypothetical protein
MLWLGVEVTAHIAVLVFSVTTMDTASPCALGYLMLRLLCNEPFSSCFKHDADQYE